MATILFVINAAIVGGAERHTLQLAADLAASGLDTVVFALRPGTMTPPGLMAPDQPTALPRRIRQLAQAMEAADTVVAVNQRPLLAVFAARRLARRKPRVVAVFHTTLLRSRKERWMQRGYNALYRRADLVVYVSGNQQRHWAGQGLRPARSAVVLNGVDVATFSPPDEAARERARRDLGISLGDVVIGSCAMLRGEKNHRQLIDAIAVLRGRDVPACAVLVGDGVMRGELAALAAERGIAPHVRFAGVQADVRPFVAAFDVGVLCSTAVETLSLAALENMAMGVPMVMSDIGGASEIIDGANGRLFAAGDTDGLVAALHDLLPREMRARASAEARRTIVDKFSIERMNAQYRELLVDHVTSARRSPPGTAG